MDASLRWHDGLKTGATFALVIPAQSRERLTSPRHSREGGNPHTVNHYPIMIVPAFARRRMDASLRWHDGLKAGATFALVIPAQSRERLTSPRHSREGGNPHTVNHYPIMIVPAFARRRMNASLRWHDALRDGVTSTPVIPAQAGRRLSSPRHSRVGRGGRWP
jgi:hypothetical protein